MKLVDFLEICGFKDFPFDIKPTKSPNVWAGRKDVLSELVHFKDNVIVNSLSEFGIITGDHGSGKSQALLHLKYMVDSLPRGIDVPSYAIYIDNPVGLGPKQSFVENYSYIVGSGFGFESVVRIFRSAKDVISNLSARKIDDMPKEERFNFIRNEEARKQFDQRVYNEVVGNSPVPFKAFNLLAEGNREAWDWLIGKSTKVSDLDGENVQNMTSHIICAKALATVVRLATLRNEKGEASLLPGVFILVDQAEDLPLAGKSFNEQIVGWRTLIDEVESSLGMLWAMDGGAEDIYANFTDAIHRRQTISTEKLRLEPLEKEDAVKFLKEVMQSFRKDGAKVPSEIYPFSEDGLEEVITQTANLLPADLLNKCRRIITRAAEDNLIDSSQNSIDSDIVKRYS